MMNQLFLFTSFLIVKELANAYPTGAPVGVCDSMIPEHGIPPQTGASPYIITLDKYKVKPGEKVTVTIKSQPGKPVQKIKGFFVQARNSANESIGTFGKIAGSNVIDCPPNTKNAITHASPEDKSVLVISWTAPAGLKGHIHFVMTVAKDGGHFWVGQSSRDVKIE